VFVNENSPVSEDSIPPDMKVPGVVALSQFFGHIQFATSFVVDLDDSLTFADIARLTRERVLDFIGCAQTILMGLGRMTCVYRKNSELVYSGHRLHPFLIVGLQMCKKGDASRLVDLPVGDGDDMVFPNRLIHYVDRAAELVEKSCQRLDLWTTALHSGVFEPVYIILWRVLPFEEIRQLSRGNFRRWINGGSSTGETLTNIIKYDLVGDSYEAVLDVSLMSVVNNAGVDVSCESIIRATVDLPFAVCPLVVERINVEFHEFDVASQRVT
jgi:hypothetical protein